LYPLVLHTGLTPEKWVTYYKTQQVLMISNELNRAVNALRTDHSADAEKCFERAMELTDLTVADTRWGNGLKELLRFREVLGELFLSKDLRLTQLALATFLTFDIDAYNMLHDT